ncbi:MAG: S41 family peptidase [Planctomycetota bacterium]
MSDGFAEEPPSTARPTRPPAEANGGGDREELLTLYRMLAEAVAQVEMNYAGSVDRRKLFESAIEGMLGELDPYSRYLGPEELAKYQQRFASPRKETPNATVFGSKRDADGKWVYRVREQPRIAYVGVASFNGSTAEELSRALDVLKRRGVDGLVLDLRSNAGGLLTAAVDAADLFLSKGAIVTTQGRNTKRRAWNASPGGRCENLPLAVLVDRYSASGAEVVAAALQDNRRATVVGERTWGKGSVQNVFEIDGGRSAMKLTTASYHRPSGINIHRFPGFTEEDAWGVSPTPRWRLSVEDEERRGVMKRRASLLAEGEGAGEPVVDRQLDSAVKAVLERLAP